MAGASAQGQLLNAESILGIYNARDYNSFTVACTQAKAGGGGVVLVSQNFNVTANFTVDSTVGVWIVAGGTLTISNGVTLTINGPVVAPAQNVFLGTGTVTIAASGPQLGEWTNGTPSLAVYDASGNQKILLSSTGDATFRRLLATGGTTIVAADLALSAGWGSTASVAITAGSKDGRGTLTVTSAGTGQAANPTVTLTFHDGAFAAAPFAVASSGGGTGAADTWRASTTTTTLVLTFVGTPVASDTYIVNYQVEG